MPRIVIQAGHCHRKTGSTGTRSATGYTEQQFTWATANRAADLLRADNHDAVVILADPPASAYRGDAFVAVHADGNNNPSVRGASVGYRTDQGKALAHAWKSAYRGLGWDGGFRGDNYTSALSGYYGTKRAVEQGNRRACIIEAGFLTHPAEAAELASPAGQNRAAQAIRAAINAVFGLPASTADAPQEDQSDMHGTEIIAAYGEAGYLLATLHPDKLAQHWRDIRAWTHAIYAKPEPERAGGVAYVRALLGLS